MGGDPRPHVLTAIHEYIFNLIIPGALDDEGYPLTQTKSAREALTMARACLHPLLIMVDYHMIQFTDFVSLFSEHANEMPPIGWVVFGCRHEDQLTIAMRRFIAERCEEPIMWTFSIEELVAAIERSAERLATISDHPPAHDRERTR